MYACPIGGTCFDELCLIMTGFEKEKRVGSITGEIWDEEDGWN